MNLDLLVAGAAGIISSVVIKMVENYRNRQKVEDDHSETMVDAAKANVDSANVINMMMRGMLDQERAYFDSQLQSSAKECGDKITNLKLDYDEKIALLQSDNESLNIRIGNISRDNTALNIQVAGLTSSKVDMGNMLAELKKRLSKYENVTTAELEAIAKQKGIK